MRLAQRILYIYGLMTLWSKKLFIEFNYYFFWGVICCD